MAKAVRKQLGEILIESGLITQDQLNEVLTLQKQSKEKKLLGEMLLDLGYITEEGLALSLSQKLGLKYITFSDGSLQIDMEQGLQNVISEKFARTNLVLPLRKAGNVLSVAIWDPLNFVIVDNMKQMSRLDLDISCSTKQDIIIGIQQLYSGKTVGPEKVTAQAQATQKVHGQKGAADGGVEELKEKAADAPVVKLVSNVLQRAVREKTSDIHIEPREQGLAIRYRVDGILHEIEPPPPQLGAAIVSRIKILSRLDIAEKRLPQDGGFMINVDGRNIDLRVSTIPVVYGEKIVIRILDKGNVDFRIASIGFSPEDQKKVDANIKKPNGLIFVTGPTGSGKSTTLYCILSEIKSPTKNLITIEDPVEYRMDTINQVQAQAHIGLDFARGLRAFLRQDPDVIMVGEVRDLETAEICVRSALVGRLVLSTLHTNDSVGSVSRLVDFGIEPFLLASTLNMIIAQRLVRKLCDCKQPLKLDAKTIELYGLQGKTVYGVKGCKECNNRGFRGRVAIFEIMCVDRDIQRLIEKRAEAGAIRDVLVKDKGMKTLRQDGLEKVKQGLTSLDEVLSATMDVSS
ncbi:MAG: ATPase, T2SS/T4P/T4SS family [Candidatus Omnitrophota bacterium]